MNLSHQFKNDRSTGDHNANKKDTLQTSCFNFASNQSLSNKQPLSPSEREEESFKSRAINQVKNHGRLISDVATEYRISKRQLYVWVNQSKNQKASAQKNSDWNDTQRLKTHIRLLQTEVKALKSQLDQYHISERLEDGKLVLEFAHR